MGHGFGCGEEICIDLTSVACSCVFCPLLPGSQVYGAFVAGVAAMVSFLPWAVRRHGLRSRLGRLGLFVLRF